MPDADLRAAFHDRGYLDPVSLFSPLECRALLARLRQKQQRPPPDWRKGLAVSSPDYHALAADHRILELVTLLIGDDVLLWGASLVARTPGQMHPWHTDIESSSPTAECVTAWIGLAGTNPGSSLRLVPFSHRFGVTVQQAMHEHGERGETVTDGDVASWAKERDSRSEVATTEAVDGDAVLFDGRLWHGSHNRSPGARFAVLLQYATPRTPIRIPNFHRRAWPFELHQAPKPPCIVVSGRDVHGVNRVVPGPTPGGVGLPALSSCVHTVRLPLEQDPGVGWKPHHLFRGSTANARSIGCHVSVLDPGRQPHPPHRHPEEELLVILDGEADLVVEDAGDTERRSPYLARRGTFAYYPAGFAHTIHNTSAGPVTYVMFKWTSDRAEPGDFLPHRLIPLPVGAGGDWRSPSAGEASLAPTVPPDPESPKGFSPKPVLSSGTRYLRRLGIHVTTLQPGAGYEPHADAYDVGIVVLDGTVETLGERVDAPGVVFYAGGELHGMHNPGETPAVYLVFEFHGRHTAPARVERPRSFWRRLWRLASDPRRLRGAIAHYTRSIRSRLG